MPSTKERILASAMRLLDTGGPDAVTLRAVGDAAGISQSAPYRHYENKRALLEAMVRANLDYLNAAFEKAEHDASSPFGVLDRTVRAYFDFARRFPVRYRFLLEVSRPARRRAHRRRPGADRRAHLWGGVRNGGCGAVQSGEQRGARGSRARSAARSSSIAARPAR